MASKQVVIIGAGPAGLTAALELLDRTDITPIVLEMSDLCGGISRTINYKGNWIDIGGHRFFSKSDRVMNWWLRRMPVEKVASEGVTISYQKQSRLVAGSAEAPHRDQTDRVMLVCHRKSRIYFLRKFFDYPIRLNLDTLWKLGLLRMVKICLSYARVLLSPKRPPRNLEEFFISRFGRELYLTFFKSYTEKVWGESCTQISADSGAQRIKGLSIARALAHFLRSIFGGKSKGIGQKSTETSLIEKFLYPKYGPGQMWQVVAEEVIGRGGRILMNQQVAKLHVSGQQITSVDAIDRESGQVHSYPADYVISTMPVKELIAALDADVPGNVREVADGLVYRDFITVGLLLKKLKVRETVEGVSRPISDNWIYVQEPDVKLGRLQIFNNWSTYMVADPATTWIGLEYFCYERDDLWKLSDAEIRALAVRELAQIGIIDASDVLDGTVVRMPKTYPAYFGTYDRFDEIVSYIDKYTNLFLVGRNGMHKYNNQDHSMLTAMTAVDNIVGGRSDKTNIWQVNTEAEYHEEKSS